MATITFDTLKLARKLEAAGFPQKQAADTAEALALSLGEVSDLATKADLAALKAELKADLRSEPNAQLRWMIGTMIGVAGCVAQQEGERLLDRIPYLDPVIGTHAPVSYTHLTLPTICSV